jgi:hypothetical protein
LFDAEDGFFIGFNGVNFGAFVRKGTVDTFIPQTSFSRDKLDGNGTSGFTYIPANMNIFRIVYGYLGIAPCYYQIFGGANIGWITFHVHDVSGKQVGTHISKPYLPIRTEVVNSGNNTNMVMTVGSVYAGVIDGAGSADASSREFSYKLTSAGVTTGTNKVITIFHNKATFGGTTNKIDDLLLKVGLACDGNKNVSISLYRLAVTPSGTSFSDIDATNSNMEISTAGTINLTGASLLDSWPLGKVGQLNIDTSKLNYLLLPNDYAVFTFTSAGTADIEFVNRWSELF